MRGSKPGERRGGRTKGTPNKATAAKAAEVAASGLTPLDYMLTVLRNETNTMEVRLDAANKAAPYVHPKLAAVTVGNDPDNPLPDNGAGAISESLAFIAAALGGGENKAPRKPRKG